MFVDETLPKFVNTETLALLILWTVFGQLGMLLNCDFKRMLATSPLFVYISLFVSIMFLFAFFDNKRTPTTILQLFVQTAFLMVFFITILKCKWYFAGPCIILLLGDQLMRLQYKSDEEKKERLSAIIVWAIAIIAVAGTVEHIFIEMEQYGDDFEWNKFFFDINVPCRSE
jgi:prolipoprotein diacylglyceryltransferase